MYRTSAVWYYLVAMAIETEGRFPLLQYEIFRFALVGACSTSVDLLFSFSLKWAGLHGDIATAVGFLAGFVVGYYLNSRFTFHSKESAVSSSKYFLVSLGGFGLRIGIVDRLSESTHLVSFKVATFVAIAIVFCWNYVLSKVWAFKED